MSSHPSLGNPAEQPKSSSPNLPQPYDTYGWYCLAQADKADPSKFGMTPFETEIIYYTNLIRNHPGWFADHIEKFWLANWYDQNGGAVRLPTQNCLFKEGKGVLNETIRYLRKKVADKWKPDFPELVPSNLMHKCGCLHDHAGGLLAVDGHNSPCLVTKDQFETILNSFYCKTVSVTSDVTGKPTEGTQIGFETAQSHAHTPAKRISFLANRNTAMYECCAWGPTTPIEVVLNLVIDDGVADRGHRKCHFVKELKYCSPAVMQHAALMLMSTINYDTKNHIDKIDPNQQKQVEHHLRRLVDKDFDHPRYALCREKPFLECVMGCGNKIIAMNQNQYRFYFGPKADEFDKKRELAKKAGKPEPKRHHSEQEYICPKCDICDQCKVPFKKEEQPLINIEPRPGVRQSRTHPGKCNIDYLDLYCGDCKTCVADKHYCIADPKYIKESPELYEGCKPNHKMCDPCWKKRLAKFSEAVRAKLKKQLDEQELIERRRYTCTGCSEPIPAGETPLRASEGVYWHGACYDRRPVGTCHFCEKIVRGSSYITADVDYIEPKVMNAMFHDDCHNLFIKNGSRPKSHTWEEGETPTPPGYELSTCKGCSKKIAFGIEMTKDKEGNFWHADCYDSNKNDNASVCHQCKKKILHDQSYSEVDGYKFHGSTSCVQDYFNSLSAASAAAVDSTIASNTTSSSSGSTKTCIECNKGITSEMPTYFEGNTYHSACFRNRSVGDCAHCKKKVSSNDQVFVDGKLLHDACIQPYFSAASAASSAPKPATTTTTSTPASAPAPVPKPPTSTVTVTTTVTTNVDNCVHCQKPLGNSVMNSNGKRYHSECYQLANQTPCFYCGEMITDVFKKCTVDGNAFHTEPDCVQDYFSNGCQPKKK